MKSNLRAASLGAILAAILVLGLGAVRAEEPRFFENPGDISRAQIILVEDGYLASGSYTPGQLDEATREALSRYQHSHALNDSGALDGETFALLLSHGISYPWGTGEAPQAMAAAEPVEPVAAPTPEPAPQLAEAIVPEPTPATAEVKEAPAPPPAPEPTPEPARTMPATASPLPLLVLLGVALLGSGLFLLRRRTA